MISALRNSTAHVFVDAIDTPVLDEIDAHHLLRVLRVKPSDAVTVSDGKGKWCSAVLNADASINATTNKYTRRARHRISNTAPNVGAHGCQIVGRQLMAIGERCERTVITLLGTKWYVNINTEAWVHRFNFVSSVARTTSQEMQVLTRLGRLEYQASLQSLVCHVLAPL